MAIYVTRWIKTDPIEGVNRIYGLNQLIAEDIAKCIGYSAKVIKYRDNESLVTNMAWTFQAIF